MIRKATPSTVRWPYGSAGGREPACPGLASRRTPVSGPAGWRRDVADTGARSVGHRGADRARAARRALAAEHAVRAAEAGVDVISAQGTESGGFCGDVGTMALVPQVVDAVRPLPVPASGVSPQDADPSPLIPPRQRAERIGNELRRPTPERLRLPRPRTRTMPTTRCHPT
ncbi:nitronate monooxygenase [Streptomyces sp. NPDC057236]|uniref:nitronate monooxygenase n=1 Tax=Streptomyces sp. NPDC057236 TaxID=3346059 RepID=UPI00363DC554